MSRIFITLLCGGAVFAFFLCLWWLIRGFVPPAAKSASRAELEKLRDEYTDKLSLLDDRAAIAVMRAQLAEVEKKLAELR